MRNLLALLAAGLLAFAGVGWYLNWYQFTSVTSDGGNRSVTIDFNNKKISEDVHQGVKKGEEKLNGVLEKGKKIDQGVVKPATDAIELPTSTNSPLPLPMPTLDIPVPTRNAETPPTPLNIRIDDKVVPLPKANRP